ncbi:type I-E CRISPR-associated protein Cse1/CasA [Streptomyces sp. HSW2009]|uniref:type I-E CRISPR-associated protein Cse1/CasA n=1 Tax=Streptomyces sp. HSW2009 TaxID=3142890 RepID=UPI0032EB0021
MWSLLDEPWLPVSLVDQVRSTDGDGGTGGTGGRAVGVRELLLDAHRFRDFEVDIPTQKPAIFRQLLLPLVVDALGFVRDGAEWAERFARGAFSGAERERLEGYFDAYGDRFDLFSASAPFAQVAGLRTNKDETKTSALLVATVATGNNVPLFSSRTDADPLPLTPAEAARWLLHAHCWDTGAIKTGAADDPQAKGGKVLGNPVGPLGRLGVVLPRGRTVYETLLLNIPYGRVKLKGDRPQWRRHEGSTEVTADPVAGTVRWSTREAAGPLDLWTWQARRIRLCQEPGADGDPYVTRVVLAAGDRLLRVPRDHETHTAWFEESETSYAKRRGKDAEVPRVRPLRHQVGRAAWRGLNALLAVDRSFDPTRAKTHQHGYYTSDLLAQLSAVRQLHQTPAANYPLQLELAAIAYNAKPGAIDDLFFDEIPLPLAALDRDGVPRGALLGAVEQAEQLSKAVNLLAADLRRAAGSDALPRGAWQYPGETLLHALDPLVRRLLVELRRIGSDGERVLALLAAWEERAAREAWKVAEQLLSNAAAPGLFLGRAVAAGETSRVYRLSTAESGFRRALADILWQRAERIAEQRRARREAEESDPPSDSPSDTNPDSNPGSNPDSNPGPGTNPGPDTNPTEGPAR